MESSLNEDEEEIMDDLPELSILEQLPLDLFGEVVMNIKSERSLINLIIALSNLPDHHVNQPDFWRKLIGREFEGVSYSKDPRKEYMDRKKVKFGNMLSRIDILSLLPHYDDEIWVIRISTLSNDAFFKVKYNNILELGNLTKIYKDYVRMDRKMGPVFPGGYSINNRPRAITYKFRRSPRVDQILSTKYDLKTKQFIG